MGFQPPLISYVELPPAGGEFDELNDRFASNQQLQNERREAAFVADSDLLSSVTTQGRRQMLCNAARATPSHCR